MSGDLWDGTTPCQWQRRRGCCNWTGCASKGRRLPPQSPALPRRLANALIDKASTDPSNGSFLRCGGGRRRRLRRGLGRHWRAGRNDNAWRKHVAIAAARLRRLEGAPGVEVAIGQAGHLLAAAEVEVGLLRI